MGVIVNLTNRSGTMQSKSVTGVMSDCYIGLVLYQSTSLCQWRIGGRGGGLGGLTPQVFFLLVSI